MSERRDVSFREGGRDGEIMIVHHQIVSSLGNDVSSFSTSSTSLFPPWDGTMSSSVEWCNTVLIRYYDYHLMTLSFACFISFQHEKRELEII